MLIMNLLVHHQNDLKRKILPFLLTPYLSLRCMLFRFREIGIWNDMVIQYPSCIGFCFVFPFPPPSKVSMTIFDNPSEQGYVFINITDRNTFISHLVVDHVACFELTKSLN